MSNLKKAKIHKPTKKRVEVIYRLYTPGDMVLLFEAKVAEFHELYPLYDQARESNPSLPERNKFGYRDICLWTVEYPDKK